MVGLDQRWLVASEGLTHGLAHTDFHSLLKREIKKLFRHVEHLLAHVLRNSMTDGLEEAVRGGGMVNQVSDLLTISI